MHDVIRGRMNYKIWCKPDFHTLQVNCRTGELVSWMVGGKQLLQAPLGPCFFRAPTDNDRGGSGGTSYLDRLSTSPYNLSVCPL